MKISRYNQKIIIEHKTITSDDIGNRLSTWVPYYTGFGFVDTKTVHETVGESHVIDDSQVTITMRWCKALSQLDSVSYRLQLNGQLFNIIGIDDMNFNHKQLKIHAQKVVR